MDQQLVLAEQLEQRQVLLPLELPALEHFALVHFALASSSRQVQQVHSIQQQVHHSHMVQVHHKLARRSHSFRHLGIRHRTTYRAIRHFRMRKHNRKMVQQHILCRNRRMEQVHHKLGHNRKATELRRLDLSRNPSHSSFLRRGNRRRRTIYQANHRRRGNRRRRTKEQHSRKLVLQNNRCRSRMDREHHMLEHNRCRSMVQKRHKLEHSRCRSHMVKVRRKLDLLHRHHSQNRNSFQHYIRSHRACGRAVRH